MIKKFRLAYIIFIFSLAIFIGGNFWVKNNTLKNIEKLNYIKGTIDYYESMPSLNDGSHRIRKKLHIKLNERDQIFKDGLFLLAGLDKEKFIALANSNSNIVLGVVESNTSIFFYDVVIDNNSLVNLNIIKDKLKMEKYGSLLGAMAFLLYGIYEIKRRLH